MWDRSNPFLASDAKRRKSRYVLYVMFAPELIIPREYGG